ncbi:MAG: uroporphyrinogen decarboxylase [Pseudomonadota bacterium]
MTEPLSAKIPEKKLLMQALEGEFTQQVPFWLMRQAGRYLPEYRELRRKAGSFLDLCFDPEMAAEITLQPVRRFDMDAAILFSDILVVPYALGQELDFVEGEGPRLGAFQTIRGFGEIDFDAFNKKLQPAYETIRRVKEGIPPGKAFIGFAGGPWTVACYMVQGRGDEEFVSTKKFAFSHPEEFDLLIETLVTATSRYLLEQIRIGVDAVQIFDSWAGLLPELYFDRWVIKPTRKIVNNIHKAYPGFPVIGFPRRAGPLYPQYAERSGVRCVGLDQYLSLGQAIRTFGGKVILQGNLDPVLLLAGGKALETETRRILETAGSAHFIFNLGHGILKETPPEHVSQLANILKEYRR